MKKKKILSIVTALSAAISLTACQGSQIDDSGQARVNCVEGCSCTDCPCCDGSSQSGDESFAVAESTEQPDKTQEESTQQESDTQQEETQTETQEETETQTSEESPAEESEASSETQSSEADEVRNLTDSERAERRKNQAELDVVRHDLYALENSRDKTEKIVQIDKQILANNAYDFSGKNIVFIGDSITEGIAASLDQNGNFVSYVTYANSYLHFARVLNHGKGGRMFADYGGEELSLALNFSNVTNVNSDIIVVFAGANDYLAAVPGKRFGDINHEESMAGYCGAIRYFMKELKTYYSDRDIFFVTMYGISRESECEYSDYDGQPDLEDYMEVERQLAEEYGFNIIELYDIGFMDCHDEESEEYYLADSLHPKDTGNIALGAHVAAELSLYFGQKEN